MKMTKSMKPSNEKPCQADYEILIDATKSLRPLILQWALWYVRKYGSLFTVRKAVSFVKTKASTIGLRQKTARRKRKHSEDSLNLQPRELVEVKSEKEILETLDSRGKNRGLLFMPEMLKYCGKKFRVYKRLEKIILESTGELRKIRNTVLLDNVLCDGSMHLDCDRSCFHYWREAWLRRVKEE